MKNIPSIILLVCLSQALFAHGNTVSALGGNDAEFKSFSESLKYRSASQRRELVYEYAKSAEASPLKKSGNKNTQSEGFETRKTSMQKRIDFLTREIASNDEAFGKSRTPKAHGREFVSNVEARPSADSLNRRIENLEFQKMLIGKNPDERRYAVYRLLSGESVSSPKLNSQSGKWRGKKIAGISPDKNSSFAGNPNLSESKAILSSLKVKSAEERREAIYNRNVSSLSQKNKNR